MNHARTFCALRLGSEAMELFDEERESKARERGARDYRRPVSRRAPGDRRETLKVLK